MSRLTRALYVSTRSLLRRSPFNEVVRRSRDGRAARDWRRRGFHDPVPPFVKTATLLEYARRFELRALIETGTYFGDTIDFCLPHFDSLTTIELDERLARSARRRFAAESKVTVLQGDSAELVRQVLATVDRPTLFWLDAHYSAGVTARGPQDTPIVAELEAVLTHPTSGHVVLIDDAHCFGTWSGYPTEERLGELLESLAPDQSLSRGANIFRIHSTSVGARASIQRRQGLD